MKPIIFSGPMVRAILDGRKTQTRRVVKGQEYWGREAVSGRELSPGLWRLEGRERINPTLGNDVRYVDVRCPYGVPGDRLWVRETWGVVRSLGADRDHDSHECVYRADGGSPTLADGRWRSPILMPREASRLTLVVESVRVERLSAITDEDALAEGVRAVTKDGTVTKFCVYDRGDYSSVPWADMPRTARECFVLAFRAMHKLAPDADPWLWVVTFSLAADAKGDPK